MSDASEIHLSPYARILQTSIQCRMVRKKSLESRLDRHAWIKAGLVVLGESGVEAVRVEPLAKRMQVTKGSFYWHFKNRDDLLDSILAEWVQIDTNSIIERVNQSDVDPKEKLLQLFEIAVAEDVSIPGLAEGRIETAIRAWATSDRKVAKLIGQVDQRRLDYTKDLFLEIGFSEPEAIARARLAYYSLVGEFMIGASKRQADRLSEVRLQHAILTANVDS